MAAGAGSGGGGQGGEGAAAAAAVVKQEGIALLAKRGWRLASAAAVARAGMNSGSGGSETGMSVG